MPVLADSVVGNNNTASTTISIPGQPGFSEESYNAYLKNKSKIHNEVARKNRNASIFDAMAAVEVEFDRKRDDGKTLNDIFNSLI